MASQSSVSQILSLLKRCVKTGNNLDIDALNRLYEQEPKRWLSLLLIEDVLPRPSDSSSQSVLQKITDGLRYASASNSLPSEVARKTIDILESIRSLQISYDEIKQRLAALPFWTNPGAIIYRLGAFVESQTSIAITKEFEQAVVGNVFDPIAAHSSTQAGRVKGTANQDLFQIIEELSACIELIIRYVQHVHVSKVGYGDLAGVTSPYEDPNFESLIWLANTWRGFDDLWARIKFLAWTPEISEDAVIYSPPDRDEFIRSEVGGRRITVFMTQVISSEAAIRDRVDSDTSTRLAQLANTLNLPETTKVWDGNIDVDLLRLCSRKTMFVRSAEYWISLRHYEPLLERVKVGQHAGWSEWLKVLSILLVLGEAFRIRVEQDVKTIDGQGCLQSVVVVDRAQLLNLVDQTTQIQQSVIEEVIESLTFNAQRKNREIWDQPLLPLSNTRVLVVPWLLGAINPARAVENLISESTREFDARGVPFEVTLEKRLRRETGARVKRNVVFAASDGRSVEYDLVMWWQNHLILIEAKCLKAVYSPADQYRARQEVEEAIEQLRRRRQLSLSDWQSLRASAPELTLPEQPINVSNILCIALTNLLEFTGMSRDGVIVTDDLCLMRFWGNPSVAPMFISPDNITTGPSVASIRKGPATPQKLREYLIDPPQVRLIRENTKVAYLPLPYVRDKTRPTLVWSTEFHATSSELFNLALSQENDRVNYSSSIAKQKKENVRKKKKEKRASANRERSKRKK